MLSFINKIFGSKSDRDVKAAKPLVEKITAEYEKLSSLTNDELRSKTLTFKSRIKEALKDFDGTLILVSHDRDFLDGLATKVFEFGNKRVKEHFEDIQGFLKLKKMESLREIEKK